MGLKIKIMNCIIMLFFFFMILLKCIYIYAYLNFMLHVKKKSFTKAFEKIEQKNKQ